MTTLTLHFITSHYLSQIEPYVIMIRLATRLSIYVLWCVNFKGRHVLS